MKNSYIIIFVSIVLLGLRVSGCGGPEVKRRAKGIERFSGRYTIKSIKLEFTDKRTFKEKTLRKILGFQKSDAIDALRAEFGRQDLEQFYLKKGFPFIHIPELSTEQLEEQLKKGELVYKITEGPRTKVRSVKFSGNEKIKAGKLRKAIKSNKKKWFILPRYYLEEKLTEDMRRLEDIYWERGFLDPNITATKIFTDGGSKVHITFEIGEGPVYFVKKIVLTGAEKIYYIDINGHFKEEMLLAMLKTKEGEAYGERRANSDARRLLALYREYGFLDAEVVPTLYRDSGFLEFKIAEEEQFRIGRIDIFGNKETQDKVVRRVLDSYNFQPGKWYNAAVAPKEGGGRLEEEIRRTVLVEDVNIIPLAGSKPGQKNVEVNVKEGQTGQWNFGAGVSSDRGVIGHMIWEQRNFNIKDLPESFSELITGDAFKGAGQSLRIALEPGTEFSRYSVSFSEPYFRDKPVSLDVIGSDYEWERESYDENRLRGYVGFMEQYEMRYRDRWRKSVRFRAENVDVDGVDYDAPKEIKDVKGKNVLGGIKLGIGKDLTDNRFLPSEGHRFETGYEQVSGDHTFGILSGTHRWYKTIHEDLAERKTILATRLRAASVLGDAPPYEKFYAGGMYSIRGFDYRGVSTRGIPMVGGVPVAGAKKKDPIGSDWIFLANAEVTAPLVSESLAALFFVDTGTIDSGGYRAAVGTGIQIMIPQWFGPVPMRFEIATPIMRDDADDTQVFSFSVGRLF